MANVSGLLFHTRHAHILTQSIAGEAIGKWHQLQPMAQEDQINEQVQPSNILQLPYRRQPGPGEYTHWFPRKSPVTHI